MPIRQLNPLVPQKVEECVGLCLQKDPAQRYQSIGEFRTDIAGMLGSREREESTGRAKARRHPGSLKIALSLAGIAVVGLLLYFFLRSSTTEINITTNPSGGLVSLDSVEMGISLQKEPQERLSAGSNPTTGPQTKAVSPRLPHRAIAGTDQVVVAPGGKTSGGLQIDLSTNKGQYNLLFTEGDTIRLFVHVSRPAYIRVIYNVADGKRILLTGPRDSHFAEQKSGVDVLLGEFVCAPPFGSETIQALASEEAFVPLRTSIEGGLCYLNETHEAAAPLTRGIQNLPKHAGQSEARLLLTTVARGVPKRGGTP